jgi:hypothetical protein
LCALLGRICIRRHVHIVMEMSLPRPLSLAKQDSTIIVRTHT